MAELQSQGEKRPKRRTVLTLTPPGPTFCQELPTATRTQTQLQISNEFTGKNWQILYEIGIHEHHSVTATGQAGPLGAKISG